MKKLILKFLLLFLIINSYAANMPTSPSLNMGTAIYVTDNSGVANVSITNYQGNVTTSGAGPLGSLTGYAATGAVFTNISRKRIDIEIQGGNSGTVQGSCGTINVSNISINGGTTASFSKNDIKDLSNGISFSMVASFSGIPTQSCTISGPINGVTFRYKDTNNGNQGTWVPNNNITVSLNLLLPNRFEHDNGAKIDFGTFCRSNQTQTLTVTSAGTEGSSSVACHSGTVSADSFTLNTAASSVSFSVTLPTSATLSNGVDNLTVNNFTSSCGNNCMTSNGSATFTVGATISIPGGSSVGSYTGTYPVSVTY